MEQNVDHDLDTRLGRMARADHPGLQSMEDAVLARVRAGRTSIGAGLGAAALAALGAVTLGAATAGSLASPAAAAPPDPLGAISPLAPSTLLLGGQ